MFFSRTRRKNCLAYINWINCLPWAFLVLGCVEQSQQKEAHGDTLNTRINYASNFEVSGDTIKVLQPSPGAPAQFYKRPPNPLRIICTSTTHLHYLELLGLEDRLVGFPSTKYIYSEKIRSQVASGKTVDIGPDGSINIEMVLSLQPDLVIAFDAGNEGRSLNLMQEAGIAVMLNGDYMETTALGRAEWLKFFGAIFGVEKQADSIFSTVESNYLRLRALASNPKRRPTIMTGIPYGGTWFLPGGDNASAVFYQEAGGNYLWSDDTNTGWIERSLETVYDNANDAEFWLGTGTYGNLSTLVSSDERFAGFAPVRNGNVFNYDKRMIPEGGNDYFESAYVRPDLILADLIAIIQPTLLPEHELVYYQRLK